MEKVNFLVDSNYALDVDGHHIDLHNNFDFESVEYSTKQNRVSLTWAKAIGDWVQIDVPANVKIVFDNVLLLKVQTDDCDKNDDKGTLSFIGYLHPEDVDLMDGCLDESEATSTYHMIIAFEGGLAIKIFSEKAVCLLNQNEDMKKEFISEVRQP